MILFGLHLNKPYLLLFDSRSWNDESWEVQLMRSSCNQSRRCIQCWDLIAPKCWEFFCHFFVGIPMENLYHCIEQIDTTCDFSVWNWDFMGFFPDFWMWIGISNGSTTVISQFMFCIISTSVGGMITAAWWLSLSNSDPMIPKMINHWTTGKSCCLSLFFLFEGCFASMLWLEKLHGKTIERPKLTRRIRRKTMATPTTTMTTRRTIALNLMLLQDCMHVSRSSQLFLPDPPPGPPVGPTFFFGRYFYFTNKQQMEEFSVQCKSLNFFLCQSLLMGKIRHFLPGRSTEPSFGSGPFGETVQQSFAPRRPLWETEKTHGTWHIPVKSMEYSSLRAFLKQVLKLFPYSTSAFVYDFYILVQALETSCEDWFFASYSSMKME